MSSLSRKHGSFSLLRTKKRFLGQNILISKSNEMAQRQDFHKKKEKKGGNNKYILDTKRQHFMNST
jgi:hypothetical protein